MVVPALIFFACFAAGLTAAAKWLPDLAEGSVGGLAFFAVCGLLAAAAGELGLHVYGIANGLNTSPSGVSHGEIFAGGLRAVLFEAGMLVGLAAIVYLLAPPGEEEPVEERSDGEDVA